MKRKNAIRNQYRVFGIISVMMLSIYSVSILFPLAWAILSAFKGRFDFRTNLFGLPQEWKWNNFTDAFTKLTVQIFAEGGYKYIGFFEQMFNTIIYMGSMTVVSIASRLIPAYVCSKYKCLFTRFMYNLNVVMMIVPILGALGSTLLIIRWLGMYDKLLCPIILGSGYSGTNFLIFYAVYPGVSWEYAEAAQMDGAGQWTIFIKIMLPMGMGTISALAVLAAIGYWTDYSMNILYLPSMPVLAYALFKYQSSPATGITIPIQLAGAIVTSIPSIVLFTVFRKKIMGNITFGGLKG